MRTLALLLLAAASAYAQPVARTSLDMLPHRVERPVRQKMYGAWYGSVRPINRTNARLRQIDAALRKKPGKPQALKLRAERGLLRKRIPQLNKAMLKALSEAGLSEADITRLRHMPRGVLRDERYNHGLVLELEDLTPKQRALLTGCVSAIDAAQRALWVQHKFLQGAMKEAKDLDPTVRRQLSGNFYSQRQQMEKRFWKIMYYALTPAQMVALRNNLSPRYGYIQQLEQHMYLLPEMSSSQATKVRALFRENESETAADVAEQRRLGKALRDKSLEKEARNALNKQAQECNERLYQIRHQFRESLKASLSETQLAALKSVAPMLNTGDLYQGLRKALQQMAPNAAQGRAIRKARDELNKKQRAIRREGNKEMGEMRGADLGPESPQQMSMQMMQRRTQSKNLAATRAAGRRILTGTMTPAQVSNWIVAPVVQP